MNEFLKNLRTAQRGSRPRQPAGTRKAIESGFMAQPERRRVPDRRQPPGISQGNEIGSAARSQDGWRVIGDHLEALCDTLDNFYRIHERAMDSQMRMQSAISSFFEAAGRLMEKEPVPSSETPRTSNMGHREVGRTISKDRYTKEEVIEMIREMRHRRCTFGEIADHLKKMGIPTFSGRGAWHAQTIHRLYKK